MADETIERAAAALEQEQTVRGLLGTACRELVETFDAQACVVSRVVGDLLILLSEFATDEGQDLGHEYLISDYPLTAETIALGEPRTVSLLDEIPEPTRVRLAADGLPPGERELLGAGRDLREREDLRRGPGRRRGRDLCADRPAARAHRVVLGPPAAGSLRPCPTPPPSRAPSSVRTAARSSRPSCSSAPPPAGSSARTAACSSRSSGR